jgi:FtsZ-interacting cell division protein YlmF
LSFKEIEEIAKQLRVYDAMTLQFYRVLKTSKKKLIDFCICI